MTFTLGSGTWPVSLSLPDCRWPRPDRPLQMASLPKELNEPIVILNCRGMVVALKPPGWEVDTSAKGQSEALSLSMFLQSQLPPEDHSGERIHLLSHQCWNLCLV